MLHLGITKIFCAGSYTIEDTVRTVKQTAPVGAVCFWTSCLPGRLDPGMRKNLSHVTRPTSPIANKASAREASFVHGHSGDQWPALCDSMRSHRTAQTTSLH